MNQFLNETELLHAVGTHTMTVDDARTAISMGSGTIAVCATPAVVASAEAAAVNLLADYLPPGKTTVGIHIDLQHLAPTPTGMQITSTAHVIEIADKKIVFRIESFDDQGQIANATHTRCLITIKPFMEKAIARKK